MTSAPGTTSALAADASFGSTPRRQTIKSFMLPPQIFSFDDCRQAGWPGRQTAYRSHPSDNFARSNAVHGTRLPAQEMGGSIDTTGEAHRLRRYVRGVAKPAISRQPQQRGRHLTGQPGNQAALQNSGGLHWHCPTSPFDPPDQFCTSSGRSDMPVTAQTERLEPDAVDYALCWMAWGAARRERIIPLTCRADHVQPADRRTSRARCRQPAGLRPQA